MLDSVINNLASAMNKNIIFIFAAVVIVVGGALYFLNQPVSWQDESPAGAEDAESVACTQDAKLCPDGSYVGRTGPNCEFASCGRGPDVTGTPPAKRIQHEIRMRGNQFVPAELAITLGDEVVFVNDDAVEHWPASGMHPTHLLCPGFDSLRGLKQGESYSHVFNEFQNNGTCPMHDHMMPKMFGKITITQ